MNKKISLIVVVGATASGKSELAVRFAKTYNGEIISADSRQCYRDLNIGTAKVKGIWKNNIFRYKGVPHFCIDVTSPKYVYTVATFKKHAERAIKSIVGRGKIPIVAGGTGFWIDTLVYDMDLGLTPPNPALRKKLEKKSAAQLFMILKKIDARRAAHIEQKNPRRLVRAIEIATALGRVPLLKKKHPYHAYWIGIAPDERMLQKRITARSRAMIRAGLIGETKKLLSKGVSKKRIRDLGFEYATALDTIEKKISTQELTHVLAQKTVAYAKRQMRWFKRNTEIYWFISPKHAEKYLKNHVSLPTRFT